MDMIKYFFFHCWRIFLGAISRLTLLQYMQMDRINFIMFQLYTWSYANPWMESCTLPDNQSKVMHGK
jgi:hypothetical protein